MDAPDGHMSKARQIFVRSAIVTCGYAFIALAFGCGDRPSPSPTAPGVSPGVSSPPAGQTHIRGSVSDTVGRPLPGALVAVLDGPLAGTTKLTDAEGRFELTGTAAGAATLRVSLVGFQTKTQPVSWRTPTSGAGGQPPRSSTTTRARRTTPRWCSRSVRGRDGTAPSWVAIVSG